MIIKMILVPKLAYFAMSGKVMILTKTEKEKPQNYINKYEKMF